MTVTVTNVELRPNGNPKPFGRIKVGIVGAGWNGDGSIVVGVAHQQADVNGLVSIDLAPSPAGTWYVWTFSDGCTQKAFQVPASGGPYTLQTLLVTAPQAAADPATTQAAVLALAGAAAGAAQKANNLSDLASASTARSNLGAAQVSRSGTRAVGQGELNINVADYASPQAAIDAAPSGSKIYFPASLSPVAVPSGGFILKTNNLTIDAMGVTFQVSNWGTPAFLALRSNSAGDGHTFRIGLAQYVGTRGNHTGALIRGSSPYCSGCGVWANGDRNNIEYLRTIDMPTPIFYSSYDGTSAWDRTGVGNRIGYLECSGYDFGLLYVSQTAFDWGNAYCHDDHDDSSGANPTHAIYCSANSTLRSPGPGVIGRWVTKNNFTGHAYIMKYQDLLTVDAFAAHSTNGVVQYLDCDDLTIGKTVGTDQRSTGGAGAVAMGFTTAINKRPNFGPVVVRQASGVDEPGVKLWADGGYFESVDITSNHATQNVALGELYLRGPNSIVKTLRTNAVGQNYLAALIGVGSDGTNSVIESVFPTNCSNQQAPVSIFAGSPGARYGIGLSATLAAAPTDGGTWTRGQRITHNSPVAAGSPGWVCTTTGTAAPVWVLSTAYTLGQIRVNGANAYIVTTAGTSAASGGPTGTGTGITDGTVVWNYVSAAAVFKTMAVVSA